ncbi:hypothetical protein ABI214_00040 [Prescottella soli]|uniref:Uncharacterized protein n=1 Tax=Prescottella soli TaxID=1543852 RepID=A0ABW9G009_9NOCA
MDRTVTVPKLAWGGDSSGDGDSARQRLVEAAARCLISIWIRARSPRPRRGLAIGECMSIHSAAELWIVAASEAFLHY